MIIFLKLITLSNTYLNIQTNRPERMRNKPARKQNIYRENSSVLKKAKDVPRFPHDFMWDLIV